ncbi:MAG: bifunctional 5,10-methylenetetrahydrofolate dehydrogenase/5,10-methenyltetrahydrofolate cyclohydrolase [Candidatus Micrarchaeia archaeon]
MILYGNNLAQEVLREIRFHNGEHLSIVLVGNDTSSEIYVKRKLETVKKLGGEGTLIKMDEQSTEKEIISEIEKLNKNDDVDGIVVQLPLPSHVNTINVLSSINPDKDVDGLTPQNMGRLFLNKPEIIPATPKSIMYLLKYYGIGIKGKNAVIVGRSYIVGRPISYLLLNENATVTVCHSHTKNLDGFTRNADILVVAVGKENLITKNMVKPNATVIDVGINRVNGELVGDCDFNEIKEIANITPVPGGVGPLTVAMLMDNLRICANRRRGILI